MDLLDPGESGESGIWWSAACLLFNFNTPLRPNYYTPLFRIYVYMYIPNLWSEYRSTFVPLGQVDQADQNSDDNILWLNQSNQSLQCIGCMVQFLQKHIQNCDMWNIHLIFIILICELFIINMWNIRNETIILICEMFDRGKNLMWRIFRGMTK